MFLFGCMVQCRLLWLLTFNFIFSSELVGNVVFEAFEASPRNKDVQASLSALKWEFPGSAVAVPISTLEDESFRKNLSSFLDNASVEIPLEFSAHASKAGSRTHEYRDSDDPSIITSLLMTILEGNGRRISTKKLWKRVRDEVCWDKGPKPWRRMPYWLVLRVALQRYLCHHLGDEIGRVEYKFAVCLLLSEFAHSVEAFSDSLDRIALLRTKLCRRLAKLDIDRARSQCPSVSAHCELLFGTVGPRIDKDIASINTFIGDTWSGFLADTRTRLPLLQKHATPGELKMSLDRSRASLTQMIENHRARTLEQNGKDSDDPVQSLSVSRSVVGNEFARKHLDLSKLEVQIQDLLANLDADHETTCRAISRMTSLYIESSLPLYQGNAELLSVMVLNVMDLWVELDKTACLLYPLLNEYHPIFTAPMFDGLLLPRLLDMIRLQKIQLYLRQRVDASSQHRHTILDHPRPGCFAERFVADEPLKSSYVGLYQSIEEYAAGRLEEKRREWERKTHEYQEMIRIINTTSCTIQFLDSADSRWPKPIHRPSECLRCITKEKAEGIRIELYEHPLPSDPSFAKAVVFELLLPRSFSLYRDTTWLIIHRLGTTGSLETKLPKCTLLDYGPLKRFLSQDTIPSKVTLASTSKPCM